MIASVLMVSASDVRHPQGQSPLLQLFALLMTSSNEALTMVTDAKTYRIFPR